ncbi:MAG: 50S ribosomal protein L9 [Muribaculaceae bacterium]|nr:50S ribosomal protein L9 [Muribaculaceae bacterium]
MKIILKEDVPALGYKDDVVEVKNGYGRNYLIPYGKAVIASPAALKVLAENQRQRAHKLAAIKAKAEDAAAALKDVALTIAVKVSETGSVYAAVGAAQIAAALAEAGHEVDRKAIEVKDVKELGTFTAVVRFHKEVTAEIPFTVVAENAKAEEEVAAE